MNYFLVFSVFTTIIGTTLSFAVPPKTTIYERTIRRLGQGLPSTSKRANTKGSILPPLPDNLYLGDLQYDFAYDALNLTLGLKHGSAKGLSAIVEDTRVRSHLFSIDIITVLDLATLSIDGSYSAYGIALVDYDTGEKLNITGNGLLHATVTNTKVYAKAYVGLDLWTGGLHVSDVETDLLFDDISMTAHNAAIGRELIDWDETNVKTYFDLFIWKAFIQPEVVKTLKSDLQMFVRGKTLTQIVDLINRGK